MIHLGCSKDLGPTQFGGKTSRYFYLKGLLLERIDNIILKCYHLNIKGVLPVAMIPRNNLRYKNTANLPGLAVFLCAVFSSIISYIIAC